MALSLSLFSLSLLPSFHPEAGSGKLKAAIRVTERSAERKVPDWNSVRIFSREFPKNAIIWFNAFFWGPNKWQYSRSLNRKRWTYQSANQLWRQPKNPTVTGRVNYSFISKTIDFFNRFPSGFQLWCVQMQPLVIPHKNTTFGISAGSLSVSGAHLVCVQLIFSLQFACSNLIFSFSLPICYHVSLKPSPRKLTYIKVSKY